MCFRQMFILIIKKLRFSLITIIDVQHKNSTQIEINYSFKFARYIHQPIATFLIIVVEI